VNELQKKIFISYSWDSEEHKSWVHKVADDIEENEDFHVTWDGYDLDAMSDKNFFMESGIHDADLILIIATKKYKEKADQRVGGVGIETFMATAQHWSNLLEHKKSNVILIIREEESTPRFLSNNIYIDFTNEPKYPENIEALIKHLRGEGKKPRPPKKKQSQVPSCNFTRVEDLLKINSRNRKAIIKLEDGTDFSGSNKIKFEAWETKSPSPAYFIALYDNINIDQTIKRAIQEIKKLDLNPNEITILRPRPSRTLASEIEQEFLKENLNTKINNKTYKEYIWEFCIEAPLKTSTAPSLIDGYTDQSIELKDEAGNIVTERSAVTYLTKLLSSNSSEAANIVIATGGMGKTSLCLSVAERLHRERKDGYMSSTVLIRSDTIRRHANENGLATEQIRSIYDIYNLHSKCQQTSSVFDETTFDLAVLSGNLVVIIDGLDELISLFQERFDLNSFLLSLNKLHEELGSTNILLTTRNTPILEREKLNAININQFELLGFDEENCDTYLKRRFRAYPQSGKLINKAKSLLSKVNLEKDSSRIVPFFLDIISTTTIDQLTEKNELAELDINFDVTPYPSNNEITDHIIHSVLNREELRHNFDISVSEVIDFISGLVIDHGAKWSSREMLEKLDLYYGEKHEYIHSRLSLNPLLINDGQYISLKYEFLESYFGVLFILEGITKASFANELKKSLVKLGTEDCIEIKQIKKYFSNNKDTFYSSIRTLISKYKETTAHANKLEAEQSKRSISSLLYLLSAVSGATGEALTDQILDIYGAGDKSGDNRIVSGLFIGGGTPQLDFTDLTISNSAFYKYKKFLSSKFNNCRFIYTNFTECSHNASSNKTIDIKMFDSSCDLGDLSNYFSGISTAKGATKKLTEGELRKFLHSFFKGDRFIDNNKVHIVFSSKTQGLSEGSFGRLLANGYIELSVEKNVDTFYTVPNTLRRSVRSFLMDSYKDQKIRDLIEFIS